MYMMLNPKIINCHLKQITAEMTPTANPMYIARMAHLFVKGELLSSVLVKPRHPTILDFILGKKLQFRKL